MQPDDGRLHGHPISEETKAKISRANKGKIRSPETRLKLSLWHTGRPIKMTEAGHAAHVASGKRSAPRLTPEVKQAQREGQLRVWADPVQRAAHIAIMQKVCSTPEHRQKLSRAMKGRSFSTKHLQRLKAAVTRPEYRQLRSYLTRIQWTDPVKRANMSRAISLAKKGRPWPASLTSKFKDTKPERTLQAALTNANIIYAKQVVIDNFVSCDVFVTPSVTVFVDGCYWHTCPTCPRGRIGATHPHPQKVARRDAKVNSWFEARKDKYVQVRLWEHEIYGDMPGCLNKIRQAISSAESLSSNAQSSPLPLQESPQTPSVSSDPGPIPAPVQQDSAELASASPTQSQ